MSPTPCRVPLRPAHRPCGLHWEGWADGGCDATEPAPGTVGLVDLADYGIDRATLEAMYAEWREGRRSKSAIERRYLGKATHHGKLFTKLVRDFLGEETQRPHPLHAEVQRLRRLLEAHGIDPDSDPAAPALPWGTHD